MHAIFPILLIVITKNGRIAMYKKKLIIIFLRYVIYVIQIKMEVSEVIIIHLLRNNYLFSCKARVIF